jgi:HPt (histidine-containing phosphotransfer) domain-containing protein
VGQTCTAIFLFKKRSNLDIKSLAEKIGIDKKEYKELIKLFIESVTLCTRRLEIYYQQRDLQSSILSAHSLKGSSIATGLQDIHLLSGALESDAKKGILSSIPERIADIKREG